MQRHLVLVVLATALSLPVSASQDVAEPNLRDRILAANTFQYCRPLNGCSNPQVIALEDGYVVLAFVGPEPQTARVRANELADYLQALPEQAWPLGPRISLGQPATVTDRRAVRRRLRDALRVFRSLGLEVQLPAGIRFPNRRSQQ